MLSAWTTTDIALVSTSAMYCFTQTQQSTTDPVATTAEVAKAKDLSQAATTGVVTLDDFVFTLAGVVKDPNVTDTSSMTTNVAPTLEMAWGFGLVISLCVVVIVL